MACNVVGIIAGAPICDVVVSASRSNKPLGDAHSAFDSVQRYHGVSPHLPAQPLPQLAVHEPEQPEQPPEHSPEQLVQDPLQVPVQLEVQEPEQLPEQPEEHPFPQEPEQLPVQPPEQPEEQDQLQEP